MSVWYASGGKLTEWADIDFEKFVTVSFEANGSSSCNVVHLNADGHPIVCPDERPHRDPSIADPTDHYEENPA